jgi:tRNA (adenine22-N1)-methyltransferase
LKLGKRLKKLDSMIPDGSLAKYDHIWDCCCDHGLLGMNLLKRNAAPNIHFVDIVPELIEIVEDRLTQKFPIQTEQHWRAYCLNVTDIPLDQHSGKQLIIIAGVGGDECIKLVDSLYRKHPSIELDFLLCPVYHQYAVRQHLIGLSFSLIDEAIVKERKQFYEIIHISSDKSKKQILSLFGSRIWQAENEEEYVIATEYRNKILSHYRKTELSLGNAAKERVQGYENITITRTGFTDK